MQFRQAHKATTYLLVLTAGASLATASLVPRATLLLVGAVAVLSWWVDPGTALARWRDRVGWGGKVLVGVAAGWALLRLVAGFPAVGVRPIVEQVLVLLAYQLLHRRDVRDDRAIQGLAFVLVAIAAWAAESAWFFAGFLAYVVVATWALVLLHLRREIEDNYLVKHLPGAGSERVTAARVLASRRVVGRWFFLVTGAAGLVVVAGAALVFLVAPRPGPGAARRKIHLAGFSSEVTLGHQGALSTTNDTIILRATIPRLAALDPPTRDHAIAASYWRGLTYDTYANGHWLRAAETPRSPLQSAGEGQGEVWLPGEPLPPHLDEQHIEVIPLTDQVRFALDPPIAFRGSSRRYTAYSRRPSTSSPPPRPPADLAPYLATPPSLTPRVRSLARTITTGALTPRDKAAAITRWLRETHRYSTTLTRDPRIADPIEDFLFAQTAGHCEYFASAAALLLRLADVPSRYVNGFFGGEWNSVGQHVAVRDNRAHAWVEVYAGADGWIRVDPTPSLAAAPPPGRLRQLADALDQRWSRWILDFDRDRQRALARRLPAATPVLAGVAAALLAAAALRRRRSPVPSRPTAAAPARPRDAPPIFRLYADTLARLERHGLRRAAGETPRELAARLRAQDFPGWPAFTRLTEHYVAARFAAREIPPPVVTALAHELRALGQAARPHVA